jgi:predicted ribosome quality control (RQC) complex YloA/Tae2 family protein
MGLIGARLDKVTQPTANEIIISFRFGGGNLRLLFSANAVSARIGSTERVVEGGGTPPLFCTLLRKYLLGGRVTAIRQDGAERVVCFDISSTDELGELQNLTLVTEIMGRASNIILIRDNGVIIDSVRRTTGGESARRILPGAVYEPPTRTDRVCLFDFNNSDNKDKLFSLLTNSDEEKLSRSLLASVEGICPLFAREAAYYTLRDTNGTTADLLGDNSRRERLAFFLGNAVKHASPTVVYDDSGKPKDFTFVNIEQYGGTVRTVTAGSFNELLNGFFSLRDEAEQAKQSGAELSKLLLVLYERLCRKLEAQKTELAACVAKNDKKISGDLIMNSLFTMKKGDSELTTTHYETGEEITIPLDTRLTPQENALRYYKDYRRLDTAEKTLTKLIASGEEELVYLESVFDEVTRAKLKAEFAEIRGELAATGFLKKSALKKGEKKQRALPPLKYEHGGFEILVGRNNIQNDQLTLKTADPKDLWLHTKNIPGSHVILKTNGKTLTDDVVVTAAKIAAKHSKASGGTNVPVDCVEVRFVKKPAGSKPGKVIFTHNKTLYVTPD